MQELAVVVCQYQLACAGDWLQGVRVGQNVIVGMGGEIVGDIWDIRMCHAQGTMVVSNQELN